MALKNQAMTITYTAWNTSTNSGQTADAANHTLKLIQDGVEAAPTNTPSEVDATNCPGTYKLALTAADMDFNCVAVAGKSSTANVTIIAPTIITERGVLPTVAPATAGGFPTLGTGAGQISVDGTTGSVKAQGPFKINAAAGFSFAMVQSSDHATAFTAGGVSGVRAIAGGGETAVSGTVTQIGTTNRYYFAGAAADFGGTSIEFTFTANGADPVTVSVNTTP